ncbi:MAG: SAM-dependent methyltransferase [Acidimicrobiales bacterium]
MTCLPERLAWAVQRLGLRPGLRVLELGCGHGLAADHACLAVGGGHVTAVDRSPAMVARAARRNARHVQTGALDLVVSSIAELRLPDRHHVVFAVDVNVFGGPCGPELQQVRAHLEPDGVLHLVHCPPVDTKLQAFADNLTAQLPANGFALDDVTVATLHTCRILGVQARLA